MCARAHISNASHGGARANAVLRLAHTHLVLAEPALGASHKGGGGGLRVSHKIR